MTLRSLAAALAFVLLGTSPGRAQDAVDAGAQPIKLTTDRSYHSSPAWSPDGTQLAYSLFKDGVQKIYVAQLKRGENGDLLPIEETVVVTTGVSSDDDPAWSPDGKKIAFSTDRDDVWQIFVMNADGSGAKLLGKDPKQEGTKPVWKPDGKQIAFVSSRNVALAAPGGKELKFITTTGYNDCPSWSRDGKRLVIASGNDLKTLSSDGSGPKPLTRSGWNGEPEWSPVDDRVVFVSNREGRYDIWVTMQDGSAPERITDDKSRESCPTWSPDAKWIAYCSNRTGSYDIWVVRVPQPVEEPPPEEAVEPPVEPPAEPPVEAPE